jgi:hypothetical protein
MNTTNNFFPYPVPKDSISSIGFHHFIVQIFRMNLSQRNAHLFSFFSLPVVCRFVFLLRNKINRKLTKGSILGLFVSEIFILKSLAKEIKVETK